MSGVIAEKVVAVRLVKEMISYYPTPCIHYARVTAENKDEQGERIIKISMLTCQQQLWKRHPKGHCQKSIGCLRRKGRGRLGRLEEGRQANRPSQHHFPEQAQVTVACY